MSAPRRSNSAREHLVLVVVLACMLAVSSEWLGMGWIASSLTTLARQGLALFSQ